MPESNIDVVSRPRRSQAVWWVIAACLGVIAFNGLSGRDAGVKSAYGQPVLSAGARGIFAFTGQITPTTYGVYMVDTDNGTLWCYEVVPVKNDKRLRLVSARSWIFDRYLEEYNVMEPTFAESKELVEAQRARAAGSGTSPNP